jgi:hypothetical protein
MTPRQQPIRFSVWRYMIDHPYACHECEAAMPMADPLVALYCRPRIGYGYSTHTGVN